MPAEPLVTIIVPVFNRLDVTRACIAALDVSGTLLLRPEVIVADDGSSDGTADAFARDPRVRVVSNPYNVGFIRNCNRAAAAALGQYLVFLNNDCIVSAGWLEWLLATAAEHPGAGAVGSKVLLPDGALSEAGLIISRDGTGYEYGVGDDPRAPRFNYVRPVDFNGGCSLLVRRDLFYALGGFNELYAPAYMDDFDFGLQLWARGFACLYQPRSVVTHVNFMTHGSTQSDALYARNRPRFVRRWAAALAAQPLVDERDVSSERAARARAGTRFVVAVDDRPYDAYTRKALLAARAAGAHVAYAPLREPAAPDIADLQQSGIEVLYRYGTKTLDDVIRETTAIADETAFLGGRITRFERSAMRA